MIPEQLPGESQRAYDCFRAYCADPKRSIRRCARKLHKSPTIIARWSKRHQWQQRLRELALEDCQRAVAADEQAKLDVARELERQRLKHTETKLRASAELFKKAFKVLQKSAKGVTRLTQRKCLLPGRYLAIRRWELGGVCKPERSDRVRLLRPTSSFECSATKKAMKWT